MNQLDLFVNLPHVEPLPPQYQNAWLSYKQTALYQKFLLLPFSVPEAISRAMLEQIDAAEANHLGPGPNFGPNPREWAERLVEMQLAAPPANHIPLILVESPRAADPRVETEQTSLVERVLAALHCIQSLAALQMLTDHVANLELLRNDIINGLERMSQLTAIINSAFPDMLMAANQLELQHLHSRVPELINLFQQLSQDAVVALRFAANVLVLRVVEWRTQQRRLANRA